MLKTLNHNTTYKNKWMEVFEDDIEFDGGEKGIYGYVKRPDGADVLIVNSRQEVLLIKQYRYPIKDFQWSIPGALSILVKAQNKQPGERYWKRLD